MLGFYRTTCPQPKPSPQSEKHALGRDEDTVVFGFRDAEHAAAEGSRPLAPTIRSMDLPTLRRRGIESALGDALAHLLRPGGPQGFWVHLDVDVLDDAVMPAVDYRLPDGLTWDELVTVLRAVVATGHVAGLDIAIFNPTLDRDGRIARGLVNTLVAGLA